MHRQPITTVRDFCRSTTSAEMFLSFHVQWHGLVADSLRSARQAENATLRAVHLNAARKAAAKARREWANFLRYKKMEGIA